MSTFALIHGGGGTFWDWHLVAPELRAPGHDPVAVDLPSEDGSAGWWDYADTVVRSSGRSAIAATSSSWALARRLHRPARLRARPAELLVLVAAMIPSPGELFADWWTNADYVESGRLPQPSARAGPAACGIRRDRSMTAIEVRSGWPSRATSAVSTSEAELASIHGPRDT